MVLDGVNQQLTSDIARATTFDDSRHAAQEAAEFQNLLRDNGLTVRVKVVIAEALTKVRKPENNATTPWANTPNEQIAGWRALVDDTDGLSKPHDMFPNRLGDNPLKVALNKKNEELHEDAEINTLAKKLYSKFTALNEDEDELIDTEDSSDESSSGVEFCDDQLTHFGYVRDDEKRDTEDFVSDSRVYTDPEGSGKYFQVMPNDLWYYFDKDDKELANGTDSELPSYLGDLIDATFDEENEDFGEDKDNTEDELSGFDNKDLQNEVGSGEHSESEFPEYDEEEEGV